MRFTLDTDPNGHAEHCVLLRAGDLLIMHGPARYAWKHSIDPVEAARLSVTLRRMSDTIVLPSESEASHSQ